MSPKTTTGSWQRVGGNIVIHGAFARTAPTLELENEDGQPSKAQIALLQKFFGSGIRGARARLANFAVPPGLTAPTLRWYAGLARAVLANPNKATPHAQILQPLRLRLVELALKRLGH